MNETRQPAKLAFASGMIGLGILGCHRGHFQAVRVPTCDGDNDLVVYNHSNAAVDVYFSGMPCDSM
jgi:hypothetical protein